MVPFELEGKSGDLQPPEAAHVSTRAERGDLSQKGDARAMAVLDPMHAHTLERESHV